MHHQDSARNTPARGRGLEPDSMPRPSYTRSGCSTVDSATRLAGRPGIEVIARDRDAPCADLRPEREVIGPADMSGASNSHAGDPNPGAPIRVFVHLAYGFGAWTWEERWQSGKLLGVNERYPYGYFRAGEYGCDITYSTDVPETKVGKILRLGIRVLLGCDLVHAWRNRRGIREADVVWTHTESQFLSVLLLLQPTPRAKRPNIIAQSVWLFDRWSRLSPIRRWFYSKLLRQADLLTFLSPENLKRARTLFPQSRAELVLFGINTENVVVPERREAQPRVRVVALGNDEHRDWKTLIDAVGRMDASCELRIVSRRIDRKLARGLANVTIVRPRDNEELLSLYAWADILVMPTQPNLHASGITVIQEGVLRGVPVICSDTGGLRAYFSENEVCYVPPQDPEALRQAIIQLAKNADERWAMAKRAQAHMGPAGLSSHAYARRHAQLSRELVDGRTGGGALSRPGGPDGSGVRRRLA